MAAKVCRTGSVECPREDITAFSTINTGHESWGLGGPVCDEFDCCDLEEFFGCDDVACVLRENVVTFHIVQEICQQVALFVKKNPLVNGNGK